MTRKLIFILISAFLFNSKGNGQPFQKMWDVSFGGSLDDVVESYFSNFDGGFIMGGSTLSGISGDKSEANWDPTMQTQDFWIIRTDSSGNKIWDHRFGGTNADLLVEIISTSDGNILAGGESYSGVGGNKSQPNWDPAQGSQDYWIIKFDQQGNKIWDKRFGGTAFDIFGGVRETSDGGFLVGGSSISGIGGDKTVSNWGSWDFWVVKTDSNGNKLWDNRYGGLQDEFLTSVVATTDGGGLFGGYSKSVAGGDHSQGNVGSFDYWVIRVNSNGTKLWDKNFGGNFNDWLFCMSNYSDGGFILGGQSFSGVSGDKSEPNHDPTPAGSDMWVIRIDANGNKIWDRTIGGNEVEDIGYIIETDDKGLMINGESYSNTGGDKTEDNLGIEQTWVVKTDSSGVIQWDKTIFTTGHDEKGGAFPINDLCFLVVNYTDSDTGGYKTQMSKGFGDFWMVKMCDITVGLDETTQNNLNIFPNPAEEYLILQFENQNVPYRFRITNIQGQLIKKQEEQVSDRINISDLKEGYYFITIESKNFYFTKPFVKLK